MSLDDDGDGDTELKQAGSGAGSAFGRRGGGRSFSDDEDAAEGEGDEEDGGEDIEIDDSAEAFGCDACQQQITGVRWTCDQCVNFDLCDGCANDPSKAVRGAHKSSHAMTRIERPVTPGPAERRDIAARVLAGVVQPYSRQSAQAIQQHAAEAKQGKGKGAAAAATQQVNSLREAKGHEA
jgi:hypothetical protein